MHNIKPFYAVKCNPDSRIIETLSSCGASFDCASPEEIEIVLKYAKSTSRIIYANPCKREVDIKYAVENGVLLTTFDSVCELQKIKKIAPHMNLVLRIYACDPNAKCILSNKYGAYKNEWENLLKTAKELGLSVSGISFHVGSGASDPNAFKNAIEAIYEVITIAKNYDFKINLIDIGGGFTSSNLNKMSLQINNYLTKYFGGRDDLEFIAEPGRYFAETIATLCTKIIGVKDSDKIRQYWINESLYASFNCKLYDHAEPSPLTMLSANDINKRGSKNSCIWGSTCDGLDKIMDDNILPILEYGEWLLWYDMGAYTISGGCNFNGIHYLDIQKIYL